MIDAIFAEPLDELAPHDVHEEELAHPARRIGRVPGEKFVVPSGHHCQRRFRRGDICVSRQPIVLEHGPESQIAPCVRTLERHAWRAYRRTLDETRQCGGL